MTRILLTLAVCAFCGALSWVFMDTFTQSAPVAVYDPWGSHPGDLSPGLALEDNAKNYGLNHDLPYKFRSNSLGFRVTEPQNPTGKPIVLVLGDSFTFGMGVNDHQTFTSHLQQFLRQQYPQVIVHNAGIPGYTVTDQLEQWREKLHTLKPTLVLLCHTASDLKEMARPTSFRRLTKYDEDIPERADKDVAKALEVQEDTDEHPWNYSQEELLRRMGASAPTQLMGLRTQYISLLLELARSIAPISFGVVFWVDGYGVASLNADPVKKALQDATIPYFDGDAALRQQRQLSPDKIYLPDKHFTDEGNQLAAKQTVKWITERGLLSPTR